jgi:broad specificity phosphatase PhoE
MSVIYFIRHAQAAFGSEDYDRLSALGRSQSRILGDHLTRRGLCFDRIYAGTMHRQISTAEEVLGRWGLDGVRGEVHTAAEFNEYDSAGVISSQVPGMLEEDPSLSKAVETMFEDRFSFQTVFEKAMLRWISGQWDHPGIETWKAFQGRVCTGVSRLMNENGAKKSLVVFSSGGPIAAAMQLALGLSDQETLQLGWQILNTSVSAFKYNRDRLTLFSFNGVAHLELWNDPKLITYR